ncbi:MAG TPA: DUF5719 family protein [Ornithinibacter sp.]|nr:DUF5719 family protein [Ornithinibacter sp.]
MSRLATARTRTAATLRGVNVAGVARVVVVGAAAAGLVHLATTQSVGLDLAAGSGEQLTPVVGSALATRVTQVCPGAELTGIPGVPDTRVAASLSAATGPADLLPADPTPGGSLTAASGSTRLLEVDARPGSATAPLPSAGPVRLGAVGALAPAVAGTQEWLANSPSLRGLVSTPCGSGASDLWLLAGGAGPGRQERLVLTNPGANPVTADVTVHGATGPLGDPRVETVPPGGRVSILLDAASGAEQHPAVHVRADGGGLHATLTDTWLDGSTALGADTTTATAAPATVHVVPAAVFGPGPTALRVAVPGEQGAVVKVTVLAADGLVPLTGDTVLSVGPGAVGELPLTGVPAGTDAVVIRSDVPVVASVLSRVGTGTAPGDIAWSVAGTGLRSVGGAAFAEVSSVTRTLHLVSTGGSSSAQVISVIGGTPRSQTVELPADGLATVPLEGATSVWVRRNPGSGELRGAVLSSWGSGATQMLSSMPLLETAVTSPVSRAFPLP